MKLLENSIVKLRPPELSDLDFLYEIENDTELWEIGNTRTPFSKYILEDYIKNVKNDIFVSKQLRLVIQAHSGPDAVGFIDLFDFDPVHLRAGIGVVVIKTERRKQYAENALQVFIQYVFTTLRLSQLYCEIAEDNTGSIQLFEKAGFKITGKKEHWINTNSGFKNVFFLQRFND